MFEIWIEIIIALGLGLRQVTVTADGIILATLTTKEFVKAHIIQFGALYGGIFLSN